MLSDPKIVKLLSLVLLAVLTATAQTGPVVLTSPNGALEISIATVRGQSVQAAGGQLAYRVAFRGRPVLEWSNLGLAIQGTPALGPAVRIESSQPSSQDETWNSVQGKTNPIRNRYNAVTVQTVETAAGGPPLGYLNAPLGGAILHPANTIAKDMSPGRLGVLPEFVQEACNNCGLCDMVCPDMCFVWQEGVDEKGRPGMMLQGIDYQYCKGCLKCVEVCPVHPAALVEIPETEGWADSHRAQRFAAVTRAKEVAIGAGPGPRKAGDGERPDEEKS